MSLHRRLLTILALAASSACASSTPRESTLVVEDEVRSSSAVAAPITSVQVQRSREGVLSRAELEHVLDQGVGAFLSRVEIEPLLVSGKFRGWQVRRFSSEWVDLVPGDVVTGVNGRRLETPAQAQALWVSLRDVDEIVVAASRNGQPFELRFTVQGEIEADAS